MWTRMWQGNDEGDGGLLMGCYESVKEYKFWCTYCRKSMECPHNDCLVERQRRMRNRLCIVCGYALEEGRFNRCPECAYSKEYLGYPGISKGQKTLDGTILNMIDGDGV